MSSSHKYNPAGQPSIITPRAAPWDSPQVVILKIFPNVSLKADDTLYIRLLKSKIIGDLPIYVALDSSDVWANIEEFKIDTDTIVPKEVAGVPPDYFSKDGQLWGNPLYNWDYMAFNGYKWWIERIDGARKLYDVIRIDHFRGLHEYWSVPYGDKTARNGKWNKGPGIHFVTVLKEWFYDTQFIAEDLGIIDENIIDKVLKNLPILSEILYLSIFSTASKRPLM